MSQRLPRRSSSLLFATDEHHGLIKIKDILNKYGNSGNKYGNNDGARHPRHLNARVGVLLLLK